MSVSDIALQKWKESEKIEPNLNLSFEEGKMQIINQIFRETDKSLFP